MQKLLTFCLVLSLSACANPLTKPSEEPLEEIADAGTDAGDGYDPDTGTDAGDDAGPPVRVVRVSDIVQAYRNPSYVARCRRESRRDSVVATTVLSKDEARQMAREAARRGELDEALIFARMAYGEAGTPQPGRNDAPGTPLVDEYVALLAVIDARRGEMSRVEMMVSYGPRRVFPHPESERNQWVAELQLDGTRPLSWPAPRGRRFHSYPAWRTYGCPRWLATVDAARAVLRAHPDRIERGPCEETPDHWGGAMDQHRADRQGWRRIQCGSTLNRFYVVDDSQGTPRGNEIAPPRTATETPPTL